MIKLSMSGKCWELKRGNRIDPDAHFIMENDSKEKEKHDRLTIIIRTTSGKQIKLDLMDGRVIEMEPTVTYISGKVYDIFD